MIGSDIARALDPARIAIDASLTPDPWQAELLRSDAERVLMLCSRQAGKTDGNWHRVKVPASMCPRISQAFLDEELKELGASRFAEEYNLEFIDPDTAAFPTDIITRCVRADIKPLWE
jgi:hypothetical protein